MMGLIGLGVCGGGGDGVYWDMDREGKLVCSSRDGFAGLAG